MNGSGSRQPIFGMTVMLTLLACLSLQPPASAEPNAAPGQRYRITPDMLPPPGATPSVGNSARLLPRPDDARLNVPEGFSSNLFRTGLKRPRWLAVAENGDVIVAETGAGRVLVLRDGDGDGIAETQATFTEDVGRPHGLALYGGFLYVSDARQVYRFAYRPGQTSQEGRGEPLLAPGALGNGSGHWTRSLAISPDGRSLYVTVGSRGNIEEEPLPRASVQRFDLDGRNQRTFASGLRNAVGIAFRPGSDELYVAVNERDGLGDELAPDFFTRVREGDFFGWPYAYAGSIPDPEYGEKRPDLVARSRLPDVLIRSHSAPIGLMFYDGSQFPADYRGDAFVALQGSWNAATPRGFMIARIPFKDGRPVGWYESFATGFWVAGDEQALIIGRPAGLAMAGDGSLLIADDTGGAIWRVSHQGQ